MKQLENFIKMLRDNGYQVITNWQQDLNRGYIEHCTVKGEQGYTTVIFQVFEGNNGYQMYIQSNGSTFEDDLKKISDIIS